MTIKLFATMPLIAGALIVSACSDPSTAKTPKMPRFDDPELAAGRSTWMGTCRNCHLVGVAGAPAVTNQAAWQPRIDKGLPALISSAMNGINDPETGKPRMPPRGGNDRLGDDQVRQAVKYMVASVEHLAKQK